MSLTRVGGDLLKQPLNIGTGVTITPDGNATFSGIVTAGNLVGSDGRPIASGAGLGTAVVAGSDEGGEQIYYTNTVLNITDNLTIDPPDSANTSYTQYQEVAVEQGKDLIVEDDFIVDVLGISSSVVTPLPGQGGRVRADRFTNKAGTGAPEFPNGVTISAGSTVTGDFGVSGDLLVGNDLTVSGSKTYLNTNSVEFKDKNIGIASVSTGKLTDGQLNGAGFTIYGLNGDKSLTWDNPNDRMAFSTDLYAPRMYADSVTADDSITVGDTFLKPQSVGIGQTTTAGRNAGVSTAIGTVIYNETDEEVQVYKGDDLGWQNIGSSALRATGGVVNEFTDGSGSYRSHTFFTSGTFEIQTGEKGLNFEFLVVGGGGGGADNASASAGGRGGGGAGGLRSNMPSVPYAMPSTTWQNDGNPASYTVTVGAGGGGQQEYNGYSGGNSSIVGVGNPINIVASGGGGGAHYPSNAGSGGSGGGAAYYDSSSRQDGPSIASPDGISPTKQGNRGGRSPDGGGGGGGAGGHGGGGSVSNGGSNGGNGLQVIIAGPNAQFPLGTPGPNPGGGYFAGGGGGGGGYPNGTVNSGGIGGAGGGGHGSYAPPGNGANSPLLDGYKNTGGGGGGSSGGNAGRSGSGGSGIVVIRYRLGGLKSAKATGGLISFEGDKTIHTFVNTGTFQVTDPSITEVDYLVVAGGGGGGGNAAGGGGAGGFRTGTALPVNTSPYTVTVGAGGAGESMGYPGISPNSGGANGSDTTFSTITSAGGGGGGTRDWNGTYNAPYGVGKSGGSGGGQAADGTGGGGSGTAGQGNAGGEGHASTGGGGGGAGQAGIAAAGGGSQSGGNGLQYSLTGKYYAGGGAGSGSNVNDAGRLGGQGGGGDGSGTALDRSKARDGVTATGGGGGGAANSSQYSSLPNGPGLGSGGSGGSGIVIISYPT